MAENDAFVVEKFARTVTPQPLEMATSGSGNMILWGDNNLYPNFLLEMYDRVPLHASIVNSKVDYIIGDGLIDIATGEPFEVSISESDTPTSLINKLAFDWNLFNAFAIAVQSNVFGKPISVYHVPMNHVRTNKAKSKFWVCDDWLYNNTSVLSYNGFKNDVKDRRTRLFLYTGYVPSANNIYPSIRYKSAITNMVTEALINDFNKNSLEDGFSAAHIISFFKGMPDTEAGKLFTQKVKEAYSGVRGAKYIIDFNPPQTTNSGDNRIKVETIDTPDYASKLVTVNNKNETNILVAHQAPSRALFGIEQAAGLNGNDLENAYQIFSKVWLRPSKKQFEDGLNVVFGALGFKRVGFSTSGSVLNKTLDKTTMEKVYTIDELRAVDGKAELPNGEGAKLLEVKSPIEIKNPNNPTAGAAFSKFGEGAIVKPKGKILTEADFELVRDMGASRADFSILDEAGFTIQSAEDFRRVELLFDDAADIDKWLTDNDTANMSTSEIRAAILKDLGLKVTSSELATKIQRLQDAGILEGGDEPKKQLTRDVKVFYEYDVRPGFGATIIPGSRGFCRKLIANDRYYTREDIQQMSAIFGYDVFLHCGGWYFNPTTNEAENQCRHYFKSVRVIKK